MSMKARGPGKGSMLQPLMRSGFEKRHPTSCLYFSLRVLPVRDTAQEILCSTDHSTAGQLLSRGCHLMDIALIAVHRAVP